MNNVAKLIGYKIGLRYKNLPLSVIKNEYAQELLEEFL